MMSFSQNGLLGNETKKGEESTKPHKVSVQMLEAVLVRIHAKLNLENKCCKILQIFCTNR